MPFIALVITCVLFLIGPSGAFPAGFDCKKPGTKLEKYICQDPELSEADDRLSKAYKQALHKSKDRDAFTKGQKEWLRKRNLVKEKETLLRMYQDRILALGEPIVMSAASFGSCDLFLRRNEIDKADVSECKVSESGRIGTFGSKTYLYTLFCIVPSDFARDQICSKDSHYDKRGITIYYKDSTSQSLSLFSDRVSNEIGMYSYEMPEVIQSKSGQILYIPIRVEGTGNYNESDYYMWDGTHARWDFLDATSWHQDLNKYIPSDTHVGSGIWPDLSKMTAEIYLYRQNDPNCCPSGGKLVVALSIKKGRFQIDSAKLVKDKEGD